MLNVIGLMSGTSMDGIDAALARTDGMDGFEGGPFVTLPYEPAFRERLRAVLGSEGDVSDVERDLTELHARAVERLLETAGIDRRRVDLIGFHGHTILHAPERRLTRQIGDGPLLARLTGIPAVNDFRTADVSAGGQGAPLVPVFHAALAAGLSKPLAVLNIGGVANITWIGRDRRLIACDTGPGNALIDDWVRARAGVPFDEGGRIAAAGRVDEAALARLLDHPYFDAPAPKSLDRDAFDPAPVAGLSIMDGAATLTAFTASAVGRVLPHLPEAPERWLLTGGGRLNPVLSSMIARAVNAPVVPVEVEGWNGDALEAQAFAHLAVRSIRGLPIGFPGTTGVPEPLSGGRLHAP